jgi:Rod binding domain-containing protein
MDALGPKYPFGPLPPIESLNAKPSAKAQVAKAQTENVEKFVQSEKKTDTVQQDIKPSFKDTLQRKGMELKAPVDPKQEEMTKLQKAARDLESYFIYSILKKFNSANVKSSLFGKEAGSDIYMDMFFEKVADQMASTGEGLGVAKEIVNAAKAKMAGIEEMAIESSDLGIMQNKIIDRVKNLKTE